MADQLVKVTLRRSPIGYNRKVREILRGLGLRKMNHSVVRKDCPPIRGMIFKVKHLVEVEDNASPTVSKKPRAVKPKEAAPKKATAEKAVSVKKPAAAKPAAAEKAAVEKPVAKKTAVKKKAPARKSTAKKSPVRATPARKPQSEKN
jgi:large subunit ribosomal protein L30